MWRELLGLDKKANNLVELIVPRRSFSDVILPPETRQQLYEALTQIEKHRLIFENWGLGQRHPTSRGLAFNFAGPPGTGKTICAEAVAFTLGKKLLRVRYAELESCWAGETGKNVRAVFREARAQEAVLFFDEADSIACRRFSSVQIGYEREANQVVNILLTELEEHEGVVVFATNMASNFDPAFERRIRTHVLFKVPSVTERERIWKVQVHPDKTPLGSDVDFRELAERFEVPGGDIRNAVLKAAQIAAAEDGPDETKRILQKHFIVGMEQVLSGKGVMEQNVNAKEANPLDAAIGLMGERFAGIDEDLNSCRTELGLLADGQSELMTRQEFSGERLEALTATNQELRSGLEGLRSDLEGWREGQQTALATWEEEHGKGVRELAARLERQEARLASATLIPWSRRAVIGVATSAVALLVLAGVLMGHLLW
jgi:hypothetical protein